MKRPHPMPEADTAEALDFLENFHSEGPWHLVTMPPDGRLTARTIFNTRLDDLAEFVDEHNDEENIYFHVNRLRPGRQHLKARKEDIVEIVALHVDVDDLGALERIRAYVPTPTVITFSGGGYQAFWLLAHPTSDLERAEKCNATIAKALGGDNCHNVDRIMRVPGTINFPNAKKRANGRASVLAKIVEADWSKRYTLDDFPAPEEPGPAGPKGAIATVSVSDVVFASIEQLPLGVAVSTKQLIRAGDDMEHPRSSATPRYPSRSEVVFHVACDLARAGCDEVTIAGILINADHGISGSIREKKNPKAYALKQARAALAAVSNGWPDTDRGGIPRPTMRNTIIALRKMGLTFGYDRFRHRKVLNGAALQEFQGELSDDAVAMVRALVMDTFQFDPRADNVRDAVNQLCLENSFHPVRDMLDALEWDGKSRIDTWLVSYLGADDTELNRAIGPIILIAAVRRVREPGVKFDQIPILEGPQGSGKSTALRILAGDGLHSDQEILTQEARSQMELLEGIWIYELGEVEGLNRAEVNKIKAFASRQEDRSRMAYGRFVSSRPRQAIFIGTTNETTYLRDQTGNRRFWPIKTGSIDLEALKRDSDQLWAEAAHREHQGASIGLQPGLWDSAAAEQAARLEEDPWLELFGTVRGRASGEVVRVVTQDLLTGKLKLDPERQNQGHTKRLAVVMRKLGWEPTKFRVGSNTVRGYERPKPSDHIDDLEV